MKQYLVDLVRREPARVCALGAAVIVFVAAKVGIVISEQNVLAALLLVVPVLVAGEATRPSVVPVAGHVADPATIPADAVDQKDEVVA